MSLQRVMAIFEKDLKDFFKNAMVLFMPIVPIFLAFLYSRMGEEGEAIPLFIILLVIGASFASVTSGCLMIFMAEEKEKNTLRGLTLSPASLADILIGKSLLTFVLTLFTLVVSFFFLGFESFMNVKGIIGLILLFLFFLFLGIGVGLFVQSVGMTTAYLMPIMFIFGFTPMIAFFGLEESSLVMKIAEKFPIFLLLEILEENVWLPLFYVFLWVLASALFVYLCFIKTRKDD